MITYISSSLPIISGIIRYKYLVLPSKFIIIFFFSYLIIETFALWLSLHKENNLYLQNIEISINIFILLGITLISFSTKQWRQIFTISALICFIVSLTTYKSDAVSSISISLFRLFSIFICLAYFNKILIDIRIKNILHHTLFWFLSGLLIFSAGTFFIMLFSEYWYKDINQVAPEVFDKYWNANQLLFIIFCLLSSLGLWFSKYDRENLI